jgi:hypothetical protein
VDDLNSGQEVNSTESKEFPSLMADGIDYGFRVTEVGLGQILEASGWKQTQCRFVIIFPIRNQVAQRFRF